MEREKLEKLFDLFQKEYRFKSYRYKLNIKEFCARVLKWLNGREFSLETMNEYSDFLREKGFKKQWGDNALHKEVQLIQAVTRFLFEEGVIQRHPSAFPLSHSAFHFITNLSGEYAPKQLAEAPRAKHQLEPVPLNILAVSLYPNSSKPFALTVDTNINITKKLERTAINFFII